MSGSYIGKNPQYGFFEKQRITTANGVLTAFNLSFTCADANQLLVSVAGVIQEGGQAYSVLSGTPQQISFTEAPATGVEIFIVWLGKQTTGPTFASGMITGKTALGTAPAADDTFIIYDESTSTLKKVAYSNVHSGVSDMAANTVKVRDAATTGTPSDKVLTTTQILIGDGTGFTAAALSGDVTMTNAGAVTIAANAVDSAEITAGAVDIAHMSASGSAAAGTYLQGDNTWGAIASAGFNSVQAFTSTAVYARPSGVTKLVIEVQGAGGGGSGGGGQNAPSKGRGGGAGGHAKKFLDVTSISSANITVGSGGGASGGPYGGSGTAGTGGDSIWADGTNTVTGSGGLGAYGSTAAHGNGVAGNKGGAATGGTINIIGGTGSLYHGGASVYGSGGHSNPGSTGHGDDQKGGPGEAYGSAGAGGASETNGTGSSGGAGAGGLVVVWEYK